MMGGLFDLAIECNVRNQGDKFAGCFRVNDRLPDGSYYSHFSDIGRS